MLPSASLPALTLALPPPAPRRRRVCAAPLAAVYKPPPPRQPSRRRVVAAVYKPPPPRQPSRRRVVAAYKPPPPRQPYRRRPAPTPPPRQSNAPPPPPPGPGGQADEEELEAAIFDFMRSSTKPGAFPTRAELLAAGRADLAAAVQSSGGWLSLGWSSDDAARPATASSAGPGVHPDYPPASETESNGYGTNVLNGLSDDWEFEETKVMHAQEELRSIRAKIAVLEGKMALEIIERNKIIEEKQMRLDEVEKALSELCTVCIVWPNPASEVLLTGSFDGWTSQRRMDRSERGIFSLNLRLYPGRYEIKFIVDGVWKNDPLRPTLNNHGHENNLLIVT